MDPSLALQKAVVTALKADGATAGLIKDRVYDRVPDNPDFPYIKIGEDQDVPDLAECINGSEVYLTIHVWSRTVGFPECKAIVNAISNALHEVDLAIDDNRLLLIERAGARYLTDPDGLTQHGVVTLRALTEPTD